MVFNISERYLLAINLLLAVLVIPYFAARTVSAMIKLHYAANVVTQPLVSAAPDSPVAAPHLRVEYNIINERDIFNLAPAPETSVPVEDENLNITLRGGLRICRAERTNLSLSRIRQATSSYIDWAR